MARKSEGVETRTTHKKGQRKIRIWIGGRKGGGKGELREARQVEGRRD